jgi:hypothetical protein
MEGEEGSGDEDSSAGGPPAKRSCTEGRVTLDAEEAVFASSLPPLHPTPGSMSQSRNAETESQGGDGDGGVRSDSGDADIDMAGIGDDTGEEEQDVGFLDNGVCFSVFSLKLYLLIFFLRCRLRLMKAVLHSNLKLLVLVLPLLRSQHHPRSLPVKSQKGTSPHGLVDWRLLQNLILEHASFTMKQDLLIL